MHMHVHTWTDLPVLLPPSPLLPHLLSYLSPLSPSASNSFTDYPLVLINPSVVSNILEEDYVSTMAGVASYTIYLLNPKLSFTYAYAYDNE